MTYKLKPIENIKPYFEVIIGGDMNDGDETLSISKMDKDSFDSSYSSFKELMDIYKNYDYIGTELACGEGYPEEVLDRYEELREELYSLYNFPYGEYYSCHHVYIRSIKFYDADGKVYDVEL